MYLKWKLYSRFKIFHKNKRKLVIFALRPRTNEYIFWKYSRNLNISKIFWACYTKNDFPIIFPKYKITSFSDVNRNLKFHISSQTSLIWNSKFFRVRLEVTEMKPHPGMKLIPWWKNFCLHVSFIPGWNE